MTSKYYVILTAIGAAKLANATALGAQLEITHMAIGDGGGTVPNPNSTQTKLVNECYRAQLNSLTIDENNTNQIIAEMVLSESVGGWYIRETGLYDAAGDLIAVANAPESYKPQLQEGSGRTQVVRMVLIVSSTSTVSLKIDPAVVLATRKHVEQLISEHEKSLKHPNASLTGRGFVQLNAATNSTSSDQAATPSAVKKAYDLAASKLASVPDASTAQAGIVQLNDAVNNTSTTQAATANAVKKTYDFANTKVKTVNGKSGTDITLSAGDVDSVSATEGGQFRKPIAAAYHGPYGYANQYESTAPYFNEFITSGVSEYHPLIKQRSTIDKVSSYAFSQGVIIANGTQAWNLHIRGSGTHDKVFTWNIDGDFTAPRNIWCSGNICSGSSYMRNDGNIIGSIYGGGLTDWVYRYFVQSIRRGSQQYVRPADWTVTYEVPDGYITGFNNSTNDGNLRFCGWYFRVPMFLINGSWVNAGNY